MIAIRDKTAPTRPVLELQHTALPLLIALHLVSASLPVVLFSKSAIGEADAITARERAKMAENCILA